VLSARYASRIEDHNGVQLAVFYHPAHEWNVERIIESLRDSISYFSETYSPYQYRQMRVLEFPAYASFAQSFPNTVPWSEDIGFIADITDPEDIDYVVGAPGLRCQCPGAELDHRNPCAVFGADADGKGIRPPHHAAFPQVRVGQLPVESRR
jgi:hypothetical protein